MSLMVKGKLQDDWYEAETESGEFIRQDSQFRNWITVNGQPGPTGEAVSYTHLTLPTMQ